MWRIDFTKVEESESMEPVPAGTYPVVITKVGYGQTKAGKNMMNLELTISAGEYVNRKFYDSLIHDGEYGTRRMKHVAKAFGLPVDNPEPVEISEETMMRRKAMAEVEIEEYTTKAGETRKKNKVPFIGYSRATVANGDDEPKKAEAPDDIPF